MCVEQIICSRQKALFLFCGCHINIANLRIRYACINLGIVWEFPYDIAFTKLCFTDRCVIIFVCCRFMVLKIFVRKLIYVFNGSTYTFFSPLIVFGVSIFINKIVINISITPHSSGINECIDYVFSRCRYF